MKRDKIVLLADTHMKSWNPPPTLASLIDEAEIIVHAGDFTTEEVYEVLKEKELYAVHGNSDTSHLKNRLPEQITFSFKDITIGVVHQGQLHLNDLTGLGYLAKEMGVDVLVFGHAHRFMLEQLPHAILVCPGSPTMPRLSFPTCAELFIEGGTITIQERVVSPQACKSILLPAFTDNSKT
jgi:hypothetical protein